MNTILTSKWAKPCVFLAGLAPLLYLVWNCYNLNLTANPLEYITHFTGDWTIRMLSMTLAVTPLRILLNRPAVTRFRRMLGLFAFFYGVLHMVTWMWFDRQFELAGMWEDVAMRPYITVGTLGVLCMLPLAFTSTAAAVRRLGFRNWQKLHRLAYVAAVAGVVHFWWLVKSDIREPLLYAVILTVLLALRWLPNLRKPAPKR
jgi:methionine sulfoxide reductase heme-binding subunit